MSGFNVWLHRETPRSSKGGSPFPRPAAQKLHGQEPVKIAQGSICWAEKWRIWVYIAKYSSASASAGKVPEWGLAAGSRKQRGPGGQALPLPWARRVPRVLLRAAEGSRCLSGCGAGVTETSPVRGRAAGGGRGAGERWDAPRGAPGCPLGVKLPWHCSMQKVTDPKSPA